MIEVAGAPPPFRGYLHAGPNLEPPEAFNAALLAFLGG